MKKLFPILLIIAILTATLTACGSSELLGTWEISDDTVTLTLTFEKDGKGTISAPGSDVFDVKWYAKGGKLSATATIHGETNNFFQEAEYKVEDNKLTVTTEEETFVLMRKE